MKLTANTILITGGSSGIGYELTKQFYQLGNKLIITGRNEDRLNKVKLEFPEIHVFRGDISNPTDLDSLLLYLEQEHKDLNVIINNAGIQYNYEFMDTQDIIHKINYEVQVNLIGPMKLIALCLPLLERQNHSAIVNISSGLGLVPKRSAPVYCGTKAGLHIFTKALRYQLEASNIKVFEVIPPLVDTPMTKGRGKNKMTAAQLVAEFLKAVEKDRSEVNIGKVKILRMLNRIAPRLAENILKNN